jgi:hypothetical protein
MITPCHPQGQVQKKYFPTLGFVVPIVKTQTSPHGIMLPPLFDISIFLSSLPLFAH